VSVIKYCRREISGPLANIFNEAFKSGIFPTRWKSANVVPVLKKGDRHKVSNYRPISLLSVISKVFEGLVHKRIYSHFVHCLAPEQHGFVKRRSTVTNLAVYTNFIAKSLDQKTQIDAIYTDFSCAFDSVDHVLLLHKLKAYGITGNLHRMLESYLCNRSQTVTINAESSSTVRVTSGVPQGSILGPLLFVMFINDLPSCFKHSQALLYADDLKLFSPISSVSDCKLLQTDIDSLSNWCSVWKLKLNVPKCNVLTFTNKKHNVLYSYKLYGSDLTRVSFIKDLGVVISSNLSFKKHVSYIVPKAYKLLGFIKRNCLSDFKEVTLRNLYTTLARPQIEYATVIWNPNGAHKGNTASVENVQRRFVKNICFKRNLKYHRVDYHDLCLSLNLNTLETRRHIFDVVFLYKIVHSFYDTDLLSSVNFRVPLRNTRNQDLFLIPKTRTNILTFSCFLRLQRNFNNLTRNSHIDIDINNLSLSNFKKLFLSILT
jgi:hypothetical protein